MLRSVSLSTTISSPKNVLGFIVILENIRILEVVVFDKNVRVGRYLRVTSANRAPWLNSMIILVCHQNKCKILREGLV